MIRLSVRAITSYGFTRPIIGRITRDPVAPEVRGDHVLITPTVHGDVSGYAGLIVESETEVHLIADAIPTMYGVSTAHLCAGDVVAFQAPHTVRTLYRRASPHNSIFATDRCNSLCLMCSQPPKEVDQAGLVEQHLRLVELIDPETRELGISGGEPTLLGEGLLQVVAACRDRLPNTALHILSNGRSFEDASFARRFAEIGHPDVMIGIPVYSAVDDEHDYIVQAKGAFDQTIRGLQNLGRYGVPVEVRVVVHRLTHEHLSELAEFIYRNLTFVSHVALMGLEITGFTIPNLDLLWIDPVEYHRQLEEATLLLAVRGMRVSIYNHQLCTVPPALWTFCRQSISDWKNEYLPQCEPCVQRSICGGLFMSGVQRRHSEHIQPILASQPPPVS